MLLQRVTFAVYAVVAGVDECYSFKQVRRRAVLPEIGRRGGHQRHNHIHPTHQLLSIRGGNADYDVEEGGDTAYDFIASFESELAEIRREAEMEAESEMEKLRELIEGRADVEDVDDVGGSESERDDALDDSDEQSDLGEEVDADVDVDVVQDEVQPLSDADDEESTESIPLEIESGDASEETIEQSGTEDTLSLDDGVNNDMLVESDELGDSSAELGVVHVEEEDIAIDVDSEVDEDIKPKQSKKKKGKSSKKGKASKKTKGLSPLREDAGLSDGGEVNMGDTVMLERIDDEMEQRPQSGIWFYLRSDLGRALCLFVATVLLAIITTRLQRQMEADDLASATA